MSEKIRKGNDIHIDWSLLDENQQPYNLDGRNITIELNVGTKRVRIPSFTTSGNTVSFVYYGKDQKYTGSYELKYIENDGQEDMVTFDTKDAFTLVEHSWLAIDEGETPETIQIEVVTIGSALLEKVGPRGYSAYEIAVQEGFVGTVDEWLAYLNGDAAGFGEVDAEVDANIGTPDVEVSTSGPDTEKNIHFKFKNIKGEKGDEPVLTAGTDGTIYSDGQVLTEVIKEAKTQAGDDHSRAELDHTQASNDHTQASNDHTQAGSDHSTASGDHVQAGNDHTQAVSDHGVAAADHTRAENDHTLASSDHGTATADHTQAGNDHTRAEGDHSTAADDHTLAGTDHSTDASDHTLAGTDLQTSASDHTLAGTDHQTAASDHTTASNDHTTAGNDHTTAGNDHTRAESDHTRAESDHTVVEGYNTRLTTVEGEVSQLGQEIDGVVHVSFYQGSIASSGSTAGKYSNSQTRVATLNPITDKVRVFVDSSDIYCYSIYRYLSGKSPMSEERLYADTDFTKIDLTAAQGRDFTIDIDETFPNVYLLFRKISSSANVPTDEVASVLSVSVLNSIRKDISDIQSAINELSQEEETLSSDLNSLSEIVNGEQVGNLYLVQGGYGNGVPVSSTIRVRINRMIAKAEAPFDIVVPENANGIFYGICFYDTLDDYTSYDHFTSYYLSNPRGMRITTEMIGDYDGITLIFSAPDRTSVITPDDIQGTQFLTENGIVQDLSELSEEVDSISHSTKMAGNSDYYGKIITLKITDELHKLTTRLVCEHYNDEYPYTTKNQSMAIWDGKAFCFNDQNIGGFCVVIDVSSGDVLARIEEVPSVLSGNMAAHLNAASFTDQYYLAEDKYPLLLLSRGDYGSSNINKLCMYVFRVTEPSENSFVFTRIKTINVLNVPLAVFNPSWDYDANRKMIWGHLHSQDWRWGQDGHRKFNNETLFFAAPTGSQYVCVTSGGATAEVSATITIRVGDVTRNINVNVGDTIEEVFPYTPYATGCSVIVVNQSANAYSGQYFVYSCDSLGNNKVEIKFACAIQGFQSPDLADPTDVTIGPNDMTNPSYIDSGIFQGGHCALGKLFLPFSDYKTINGQPTDYLGHCCLVVNPLSGYIESAIKTDSKENEGCAVWNGKLYISSHDGNATGHKIGFRLIEYTFD